MIQILYFLALPLTLFVKQISGHFRAYGSCGNILARITGFSNANPELTRQTPDSVGFSVSKKKMGKLNAVAQYSYTPKSAENG